jgi:hypothetical protein
MFTSVNIYIPRSIFNEILILGFLVAAGFVSNVSPLIKLIKI